MQEAAIVQSPVIKWETDPHTYEKWVDRARGTKHYHAVFICEAPKSYRLSKRKFRTATEVVEWMKRFQKRFSHGQHS
jgi:hypothetical protein